MIAEKVLLADKLGVRPEDLNDDGSIKPYELPVFEDIYSADELAQGAPPLADILAGDPVSMDQNPDHEISAGFCPGGSWSGGICTPFNNAARSSWMGTYQTVAGLRIQDAIIPGTHQSGFDKQAPYVNSMETCQDVSPHAQLHAGIRALDIRVQFYSGYPSGDPRRFSIFHDKNSGRTVEGDIVQAVINLHSAASQEIVILDFHQFKNFTEVAHKELTGILKRRFGQKIISPSLSELVIGQLWWLKKNVVIAYNATPRDTRFWAGVNQRWIGSNTPSSSELKRFIDRVAQETKPRGELRSIQAAKYVWPFHVPDDMSSNVMSWFAAGDSNSPIMKFYIINTDWSLRHRFVDNCIYANQFRYAPGVKIYDPCSYDYIPGAYNAVYHMFDGCWLPNIALPRPVWWQDEGRTLIVASDATYEWTLTLDNFINSRAGAIPINRGDRVVFVSDERNKWDVVCDVYTPNGTGAVATAPQIGDKCSRYTMSDGDFVYEMSLPASGPDNSIIFVSSTAGYTATISGNYVVGGDERALSGGDNYAFVYRAALGKWAAL